MELYTFIGIVVISQVPVAALFYYLVKGEYVDTWYLWLMSAVALSMITGGVVRRLIDLFGL